MKIKLLFLSLVFIVVSLFFKDFILQNKLPIPSDTIVGLYYPYKDLYTKEYPRGVPFKNFMITDPIRQQYPWKNLSINLLKKGELPLWNPYTFAGQPLLANFQSGAFYPFNIVFFILSFPYAWSVFIILQSILSLIFTFLYLNNLKLDKRASFFGALAFAFGGFSISWLEWGNVIHTALWLPLILLSIDKTLYEFQISPARNANASVAGGNFKFQIESADTSKLIEKEELELIRNLLQFPNLVEEVAKNLEVNAFCNYALETATLFHKFYETQRVISDDKNLTQARLALLKATQITLKNTLDILGVSAPEKM